MRKLLKKVKRAVKKVKSRVKTARSIGKKMKAYRKKQRSSGLYKKTRKGRIQQRIDRLAKRRGLRKKAGLKTKGVQRRINRKVRRRKKA